MPEVETLPRHLQEQILAAELERDADPVIQESDFFTPGDGEVAALTGGKMRRTATHPGGMGYITLYDTSTGEPRRVLQYMAPKILMKQRNGRPAFSRTPTKEFKLGDVMCFLHPDHPERETFRAMGLDETKDCGFGSDRPPAAHLASPFDREQHMMHRHSREWQVILNYRAEQERLDARRMQQEQIDAMREMAAAAIGQPQAAFRGAGTPMAVQGPSPMKRVAPKARGGKVQPCPDCGKADVKNMGSHQRYCSGRKGDMA